MIETLKVWALRDGEADVGMEGDYTRWFREHPFLRYTDLAELIPKIKEKLRRGEYWMRER